MEREELLRAGWKPSNPECLSASTWSLEGVISGLFFSEAVVLQTWKDAAVATARAEVWREAAKVALNAGFWINDPTASVDIEDPNGIIAARNEVATSLECDFRRRAEEGV